MQGQPPMQAYAQPGAYAPQQGSINQPPR